MPEIGLRPSSLTVRVLVDGLISQAVGDLWEPWMPHADQALEDEALLLIIQQELAKRCKKSETHGRPGTTRRNILRASQFYWFSTYSR
jgi:hypothetical protein